MYIKEAFHTLHSHMVNTENIAWAWRFILELGNIFKLNVHWQAFPRAFGHTVSFGKSEQITFADEGH